MNRKGLSWLLLLFCQSALAAAAPTNSGVLKTEHSFAPVTFSIGCGATTRSENRRDLKGSDRAVGFVHQIECVDIGKQVEGVKLVAIAIGENEQLGSFDVILKLDSDSA